VLIAADLVLTKHTGGWRAAAVPSALWIVAALAFGGAASQPRSLDRADGAL
jgi:hypothetical protein